jgi:hypothetical protein
MKSEVLNALLTARTLFDTARRQCMVRDRHTASAGLIVLQDAVELVLYACLIEKGVDDSKAVESLTFDQLIGELRRLGLRIMKSGTLKAMNKQRVLIKHHAQLAEPAAVQNFFDASLFAIDGILTEIIGKPLRQVVLADAIVDPKLKALVEESSVCIEDRRYIDALIATRKVLFLAVENEYDVARWKDYDASQPAPGFQFMIGNKAPYHTRNKEWIKDHVLNPADYLQLDLKAVETEMMGIGIDPVEFLNVWRLTPTVYRLSDDLWAVKTEPRIGTCATEETARYCLDVVVSIVLHQQLRKNLSRYPEYRSWKVRLLRPHALLKRASLDSEQQGVVLAEGDTCNSLFRVSGFDGKGEFVYVFSFEREGQLQFYEGYLPVEVCDFELILPTATPPKEAQKQE